MACVLVAEDDAEMRRLVVDALRKDGHQVTEAPDGGHLLARLAEVFRDDPRLATIDVIVSDLRMPGVTGLDLLERMSRAGIRVPFILMTAFGDDETRRRVERAGAIYLDKPLSLAALRHAVQRLTRP
jgi:CheY-like chemotaxis protein